MGFFDGLFGTPSTSTLALNSSPANSRNMNTKSVTRTNMGASEDTNISTNSKPLPRTNVSTNSRNTGSLARTNMSSNMNSGLSASRNNGPTMKALIGGGVRTRRVKSNKKGRKSRSKRARR
jgi:hypothetical protein